LISGIVSSDLAVNLLEQKLPCVLGIFHVEGVRLSAPTINPAN
jgi:hypothetical protein